MLKKMPRLQYRSLGTLHQDTNSDIWFLSSCPFPSFSCGNENKGQHMSALAECWVPRHSVQPATLHITNVGILSIWLETRNMWLRNKFETCFHIVRWHKELLNTWVKYAHLPCKQKGTNKSSSRYEGQPRAQIWKSSEEIKATFGSQRRIEVEHEFMWIMCEFTSCRVQRIMNESNDYDTVVIQWYNSDILQLWCHCCVLLELHSQTGSVTLRFCVGGSESLDACAWGKTQRIPGSGQLLGRLRKYEKISLRSLKLWSCYILLLGDAQSFGEQLPVTQSPSSAARPHAVARSTDDSNIFQQSQCHRDTQAQHHQRQGQCSPSSGRLCACHVGHDAVSH